MAMASPHATQAQHGAVAMADTKQFSHVAVEFLRSEAAAAVHAYALLILFFAVVGLMGIIVGGVYLAWRLAKYGVDAAGSTLRRAAQTPVAEEVEGVVKFYQSPAGEKLHMTMGCSSLKDTNPKMIKEHALCLICSRRFVEKAHVS